MHLRLPPQRPGTRALATPFLVALFVLACIGPGSANTPAISVENGGPRVRPNDGRLATLLRIAIDRSPTVRALVDRIEKSDVIVYLEMEPRIRQRLSGCVTWVTAAGRFRYVRASINPDLAADQHIAAIGHELQHVIEIVEAPLVTSESSLLALYRRIGQERFSSRLDWDTVAAQQTSESVRRELSQVSTATADASASISPLEWHTYYQQERARSESAGPRWRQDAGAQETEARSKQTRARARRTDVRSRQ